MSTNAFCVHGHFYQPPREDPFSGVIPVEMGAAPYKNWNEKINAECYRPNAERGNYRKISYNFGPTLLSWMQRYDPETYNRIIAQDKENFEQFGVGNAIAQGYNHTILPLASRLDKITQIRWGIADYKFRFGHSPAGLWLPETAADLETLEILAENGISFTLLAPWQAEGRPAQSSMPYWIRLRDKRKIAVFFYNQDLSTRVSFDPGATINADSFINYAVLPEFDTRTASKDPKLILVASDGELYGHHQPFRDQFLGHLLNGASRNHGIELTYPGLWLQQHPPRDEIRILDNTSWSCHHGVTRWNGECDCTPGSKWKAPLRRAFDRLAVELDDHYFNALIPHIPDPWELRHRYIHVILGEARENDLIRSQAGRNLEDDAVEKIGLLLAAQYERQRMFTSCGWFFDEFERIEPKNNIGYAAHAIWLNKKATGNDLSHQAASLLKKVSSQRSGLRGDLVFNQKYLEAQRNDRSETAYFKLSSSFSS